ncbi:MULTISPECIES: dihydrodipicolinate synthase family protein [unclassified Beijerinckia]|uniref:dihydrodipicolinate synthase family protein n=1 Tax=unclassified Beijerinckia TaxID=2638183 RepID=UPI0008965190|nr:MULTISPECIES: dihydrodipicolinate synthase family protein [unclassified Beijerinckia]MDH7795192.1 dihydrodipicolinate synthase/N-acetylneuraminate lyase [Beijerinckia sp. GAS462]SEB91385.1 4-hydroxy-tetrahydrodipicolinate synthase [Beijerinckia sp. 28-YEA-48]
MALPYTRKEVKERVRATWKGACNVTLPSFTSQFDALNEKAIEHDVRLGAKMGFWGTLIAQESGTTFREYLQFMDIAAAAAPKGFNLITHLSFDTVDEMIEAAKTAETLGYEGALLSYPPSFRPKSAADIVAFTKAIADATDLALILFDVPTWGFKPLHPSAFPPEAMAACARLPTAASVKYEANPPGMISGLADLRRLCGNDAIIQCPLEHYAPGLVDWYGMPFMGTSAYDSFGDRVPRWFKLLHEGKWDEAMQLYWSYQPAREAKGAFHATFGGANLIHRNGWKYVSWLHGYSGGLLRMPQMRLNPNQMRGLRAGLQASNFDLPASDDGFYPGLFPVERDPSLARRAAE